MKEMCRNFICSNNHRQVFSADPPSAITVQPASALSDSPMDSCSDCVKNRIGLAQAYIPSQPYTLPMEQEQSLVCGTVFSDLVMPYCSGWNLYRFREEA